MNQQQINTNFDNLASAFVARNLAQYSSDTDKAINKLTKNSVAIKLAMKSIKNDVFLNFIAMQTADISLKGSEKYCAVKVNVKLLDYLIAIAQKSSNAIDSYSASIISNTFFNSNELSAKSALMSLCRDIEYNELETVQKLKNRCNVKVTTASTQRSSSREALRIFALANITKGKKNENITLSESGIEIFTPLLLA